MYRCVAVAACIAVGLVLAGSPAIADCVSGNPIEVENCLPGSPPSEWDVSGAGDSSIEGFATDISVNRGGTVDFKIRTNATAYRIDIYRLGYYQGNGARKVATISPSASLPQTQPACLTDPSVLLTDCGNWSVSASWIVPADSVSGIYVAKAVRTDTGGATHIAFVVRDDASGSDLLFKTSDTTWQAYNSWGNYSLYVGPARKVSYNRPFYTRGGSTEDWLFNAEYPMVRWLEANGYDVTYTTDIDTDKYATVGPNRILAHKVFLSVGHDEYWSAGERGAVEAAREAGVNLAFFSGNESYWKIRWEPSTDPSATPFRTLVCYKEGTMGENTCGGRCDPLSGVWTGLWRSGCPPEYSGLDGCRPENALSGNISWVGSTSSIQVPQSYSGLRFWRNTGIATLPAGQVATLAGGTLGYEWDFEQYLDSYPPGRIVMSETTFGGQTHHLSLYRHYSGGVRRGLVFGAGTVQWSWGLDGTHDRGSSTPDVRMQQATVNLFADMGAQPATLQPPLTVATASTDVTAPASSIDSPLTGSTVQINVPITISGLAGDTGGVVGVVEVSVDGGATWRRAVGRETWSTTWTPAAYGDVTIKSRAADDSGNIETPGAGVTVTVGDTPSGPPHIPVANGDYYTTDRNVQLTVPAPGVLANDSDPDSDPITAVLRTGTTHGVLTFNPNGSFIYTPALDWAGADAFTYRAQDYPDGNLSAVATVAVGVSQTCPCTLFLPTYEPVSPWENDPSAVELGVRFRSDVDGYITAIRFYKHAQNTGTHVAHLWTAAGVQLVAETFTGESASDWQEVTLANPVAITAGSVYIASYHTTTGYAQDTNVFAGAGVDSPPLHALQDGVTGPNGVYSNCASPGCFPTSGFQSSNYYVDVVFALTVGPDVVRPTVTSVAPPGGATGVAVGSNVTANFSEAINPATITGTTFELRDGGNNLVTATVTYSVAARQAVLDPAAALAYDTTYTATVRGGDADPTVRDLAGNALASDTVWSFTTASPPPPGPDEGPGGPILVVASSANPFGRYFAEILRTEGLNYFTVTDLQNVTPALLGQYRAVILGETSLSSGQVTTLTDWVTGGGRLIAMRPDKQLKDLLGLTDAAAILSDKYLLIDTAAQPGAGLVNQTIQFHGAADLYTLSGATALATLYSDAATPTAYPAVTIRSVGEAGGTAAAFTFDLAKSVVYTRQGNPAWIGQDRDGRGPRAQDMFYGNMAGDPQPDWIDLNKVAIPQADEQQRLLAKLIQAMDPMPLPRFWYFPRMKKAVVIMTGDDEGSGQTPGRWDRYITQSPSGCSVADWECIRGSSYLIGTSGQMSDAQALTYTNLGFELGVHVNTGCGGWTPAQLENYYATQLAAFQAAYPSIPSPASERTHCIAWSDWDTNAHVQAGHNIRLDTNYYYWPPEWVAGRPGYFTGSGMLMRFADVDGTMVDNYQSATQIPDESGLSLPPAFDAMIAKALGPEGYYAAIDANMHTTSAVHGGSDAIVQSALLNGIPVVSGRQMAEWLDGRNASNFGDLSWDGNVLSFSVTAAAGARNLRGMIPRLSSVGAFTGITRGGVPIAVTLETIKGVEYAVFDAISGAYAASYAVDTTPPEITNVSAAPGFGGTAVVTWDTLTEASDSRVDYGTISDPLNGIAANAALVTSHSITLTGLLPNTVYYYRVTSKDSFNNSRAYPVPPATLSFATPAAAFQETTAADFAAGTTGGCSYVSETGDGEVILKPAEGAEFPGSTLPAGWTATPWMTGATATVSGGMLRLSGMMVGTDALYPAGRAVDFVATFSGAANQHAGFGINFSQSAWAMFSTMAGGGLYARSNGSAATDTLITGSWLGSPHRFRVEWTPTTAVFFIDGTQVASHTVTIGDNMRPLASDYVTGDGDLLVDWMRLSPYPASCSYLSRVLDAGQLAAWGAMSWTAETPGGTSIAMSARMGNTPVPDDTWTGWSAVSPSGAVIGGQSQYLQYGADLMTPDGAATPALKDVTIGYGIGEDTTPPAIAGRSPSPGATGVDANANVVVQFSEPMNAATVNGTTLTLRSLGTGIEVPAVVGCAGSVATLDPVAPLSSGQEYRVTVSGSVEDLAGIPLGADDTWTFTIFADVTPPSVTGRTPAPGSIGVDVGSNIVVQFSEAMDPATIGTSTIRLRQIGAGSDVPAAVSCAGARATLDPAGSLLPGSEYRVTVSGTVTDLAGNPLGADDTWTFFTLTTAGVVDTTVADFSGGSGGACSIVAHSGDGELTLAPTIGVEFDGTSLPTGWASYDWALGASYTFSGEVVTVDGGRIDPDPAAYGPGRSVEFVATFAATPYQHVGLGAGNHSVAPQVFNNAPWAMFGTGEIGTALQARVWSGGAFHNYTIPGSWLGAPHRYRVDWSETGFDFYIDGALVHSWTETLAGPMRPAISDYTVGAPALTVDWLRMSDYASPCAFESRIFDGGLVVDWVSLAPTGSLPAGASYAFETRTGNTPVPDGSWSGWEPVSGTAIPSPNGKYLQYRATLSTSDVRFSPELERVEIGYNVLPDSTSPTVIGRSPEPGATDVSTTADVTVQFSEPMNPATIDASTIRLRDTVAGADVAAAVTYYGITATLDPVSSLIPGREYQVTVAGTVADLAGNPLGADDTWSFRVYLDITPPAIIGRSPSPGATGVTTGSNVTVQFSEAMNPATLDSTSVRLRAAGGGDVPAVVTYSGLTATLDPVDPLIVATAYRVTVAGSVTDLQGNPLGADDTWTFTTFFPQTFSDTATIEFAAGTPGGCSVVEHTGDGEVTLTPALGEEFSGTDLPAGWATSNWGGGSYTISGGTITVDAMCVDPDPAAYDAGSSLEFVATFGTQGYQHVGLGAGSHGTIYNTVPWTIFSTGSGGGILQARTWSNAGNIDYTIPGSWVGVPHRFKIVWTASSATYFIDGDQVANQAFSHSSSMRPALSDLNVGTSTLSVDWMRMSPYASSCALESRVFDGGKLVHWSSLTPTGSLPAATGYSFETRSGNSAVPNGTWSDWAPVSDTTIGSPNGRYFQYRVTLSTADTLTTPELQRVDIGVDACVPEVCNGLDDDCDGSIDEELGSTTCGLGVCLHTVENCVGGQSQTCNPLQGSGPEVCNGLDDDCDGVTDNGGAALCDDLDACTADACTAGACVHTGTCGVGGSVFYYRENGPSGTEPSPKPVPNVGIGGSPAGPALGTTDASGAYLVEGLHGSVTLTPVNKYGGPRAADENGAVTSLDAARVAMAAVGNGTVSVNQFLAGDVTGNRTLSALDASYVARFAVGLVGHFPVADATGSDWSFLKCEPYGPPESPGCGPPVYTFSPISPGETGKNFYAVLYGEVTGNWQPAAGRNARTAAATSPEEMSAAMRDQEAKEELLRAGVPSSVVRPAGMGPAELALGGWKALRAGERRQVTVDLRNAEGILGLDLTLTYDPALVRIAGLQATGIGSRLSLAQVDEKGALRIAAFGVLPLSGSGSVLSVIVEAVGTSGRQSPLRIDGVANEGAIPLRVRGQSRPSGRR